MLQKSPLTPKEEPPAPKDGLKATVEENLSTLKDLIRELRLEQRREVEERQEHRLIESRIRRLLRQEELRKKILGLRQELQRGINEIKNAEQSLSGLKNKNARAKFLVEAAARRAKMQRDLDDELLVLALLE